MILAEGEAIAARAQPPGKGSDIASLKNGHTQFAWDGYLLHVFWDLWLVATKSVAFKHSFLSY